MNASQLRNTSYQSGGNVSKDTVPSYNLFYGHSVLNVRAESIRKDTRNEALFSRRQMK